MAAEDALAAVTGVAATERGPFLLAYWQNLQGQELARPGPYQLWHLDRRWLDQQTHQLLEKEKRPSCRLPRLERFCGITIPMSRPDSCAAEPPIFH